jgi:hypothetical protein
LVISTRQRRLVITATVLTMVFLLGVIAIDVSIGDVLTRHILIVGFGLLLVIIVAGLSVTTMNEPKRWKHVYKPQKYDSDMVPIIRDHMGRDVRGGTWAGYQERVKACLWLREAMAEYVEHVWTGSPYDFNRMLNNPEKSKFLKDKPALKKILVDMQDLGVYREGSSLLYKRRMFLKLVDKMFTEVEAP